MLPTDKRFKALTGDQMEILFINFLKSPSTEEYKQLYRELKEKEKTDLPAGELEAMGYSAGEIESIQKDIVGRHGI